MYSRQTVTGSVETENLPLSESSDITVMRYGTAEVGVCWNPMLWKKPTEDAYDLMNKNEEG